MRLLPPERKVEIYKDGFKKADLLSREESSQQLSELVEKIDDPLVIALNGSWGSGKSFFLKSWVGAHSLENSGTANTVYFDAFSADYLDDPLIALTSTISDRFQNDAKTKSIWDRAKGAAAVLWRPAARIGLAVASAGATEAVGAIADGAIDAAQDIANDKIEDFWKKEDGRKGAMLAFTKALEELTAPIGEEESKKLVVVVDELDRCRPDYALSVLEVIKHFFAVPNVHFVLGVNLAELANTIRARYGAGVDAHSYLQKFISVTIELPQAIPKQGRLSDSAVVYFSEMANEMGLQESMISDMRWHFDSFPSGRPISIREVQKMMTEMALIPLIDGRFDRFVKGYRLLICGLIFLKIRNPNCIAKARRGELSLADLEQVFGVNFKDLENVSQPTRVLHRVWAACLEPEALQQEDRWQGLWGRFGLSSPSETIPKVVSEYIDVFKVGAVESP